MLYISLCADPTPSLLPSPTYSTLLYKLYIADRGGANGSPSREHPVLYLLILFIGTLFRRLNLSKKDICKASVGGRLLGTFNYIELVS